MYVDYRTGKELIQLRAHLRADSAPSLYFIKCDHRPLTGSLYCRSVVDARSPAASTGAVRGMRARSGDSRCATVKGRLSEVYRCALPHSRTEYVKRRYKQ